MPRLLLLDCVVAFGLLAVAQDSQPSSERKNIGFEGPVRSVATTVQNMNADPRPVGKRALQVGMSAEWYSFDESGNCIERSAAATPSGIGVVSKRSVKADGTVVWTDSRGNATETRRRVTTLANGSREVTYYTDSKIQSREITRFDDEDRVVAFRIYDGEGRLTSDEETVFEPETEMTTWKLYDQSGRIISHEQTRVPNDHARFDRWNYEPDGKLAWHVSLNEYGELLTFWYAPGFQPKVSSSDSLGICRPKLCVSYKFDERGHLEKHIQHTSGEGNLEPNSEEHYNAEGQLDERVDIKYTRDDYGNWTSRSLFVWDPASNQVVEVERDLRKIEYYQPAPK